MDRNRPEKPAFPRVRVSFNTMLFAVSFVVCLIIAALFLGGRPRGASERETAGNNPPRQPMSRAGSMAAQLVGIRSRVVAPGDSDVAPADLAAAPNTEPQPETKPDNLAGRRPELDLPIQSQPESATPQITPAPAIAYAAPPIALPDGMGTPYAKPSTTPDPRRKYRNIPQGLRQTPWPILSNVSGTDDGMTNPAGSRFSFPSDAGRIKPGTSLDTSAEIHSAQRLADAQGIYATLKPDDGNKTTPAAAGSTRDTATPSPRPRPSAPPAANPPRQTPARPIMSNATDAAPPAPSPPPAAASTVASSPAAPEAAMPPPSQATGMSNWTPNPDATIVKSARLTSGSGNTMIRRGQTQTSPPGMTPLSTPAIPPDKITQRDTPAAGKSQSAAVVPNASPINDVSPTPSKSAPLIDPDKAALLPPEVRNKLGLSNMPTASVGDKTLDHTTLKRRTEAAFALMGKPPNDDQRPMLEMKIAEDWAENTAIALEARRQGIKVSDDEVRQFMERQKERAGGNLENSLRKAGFNNAEIMEQMRDSALCEKLIDTLFQKNFDDKKIRAVYDANPAQFQPSRRIRAQEIFKTRPSNPVAVAQTEQQMRQLQQQTSARGADFASLASQNSEASSRERGGDMGWLDASSNIRSEIGEALARLKPGQVSPVINSVDGFRIVKLAQIEEPAQGFDGARNIVVAGIRTYLRRAAYETAKKNFRVTISGKPVEAGGKSAQGTLRPDGSRVVQGESGRAIVRKVGTPQARSNRAFFPPRNSTRSAAQQPVGEAEAVMNDFNKSIDPAATQPIN